MNRTSALWQRFGFLGDVLAPRVPLWVSALFVGMALAITAFPILARIISECGLTGTRSGRSRWRGGALDDGVAWVLLAVVIGAATGDPGHIRSGATRCGRGC